MPNSEKKICTHSRVRITNPVPTLTVCLLCGAVCSVSTNGYLIELSHDAVLGISEVMPEQYMSLVMASNRIEEMIKMEKK